MKQTLTPKIILFVSHLNYTVLNEHIEIRYTFNCTKGVINRVEAEQNGQLHGGYGEKKKQGLNYTSTAIHTHNHAVHIKNTRFQNLFEFHK